MKKIYMHLFLMAALCGLSFAQSGQDKHAAGTMTREVSVSTSAVPIAAAAREHKGDKPAEKKAAKTGKDSTQEEEEYSEVLVDISDHDSYNRPTHFGEEKNEKNEEMSLPYLYGALKGSFNDGAKNILVFENDDGVITFIQVFLGKNSVSWKFLSQINRN